MPIPLPEGVAYYGKDNLDQYRALAAAFPEHRARIAAGQATPERIAPELERREHEKELERQRLARKRTQKNPLPDPQASPSTRPGDTPRHAPRQPP
ncbi:MAG: hypothetical protein PHU85_08805 [Phycisphaerae bacterium]|nr:hypothetical protein [Phycisphaerae bacterium]